MRPRAATIATVLLCCLSGAVLGARQQTVSVTAENGTFEFSGLTLDNQTIRGQVKNNTTHDWRNVDFAISFYDAKSKG